MQGALPPRRPNVVEMKGGNIPGWRNVKKKIAGASENQLIGYSVGFIYAIGFFELLAAIGLIVGLWRAAIGYASLGVIFIILLGAVGSSLIAGLYAEAVSPLIVMLLTALVFLGNRYVSNHSRRSAGLSRQ